MDHEPQVGLVKTHAKRGRRHQRLHPVVEQILLGGKAIGGLGAPGIGGDQVAAGAQERGDLVGLGDGEGVDNA